MRLWIALAVLVPGRVRRAGYPLVDDRALRHFAAAAMQMIVDRLQQHLAEFGAFE